jgi:hypothetical protein
MRALEAREAELRTVEARRPPSRLLISLPAAPCLALCLLDALSHSGLRHSYAFQPHAPPLHVCRSSPKPCISESCWRRTRSGACSRWKRG